tara:strand:- start:1753 stop:2259 length:507 start_codon:yes stop_codon:yes gene_type:complete
MIGGKMKNKEFKKILKEWNEFTNKNKINEEITYQGKNIETIGDLKEALKSLDQKKQKIKNKGLVKTLLEVGIDLVEIVSGGSQAIMFYRLCVGLSRIKDTNQKKLDNLSGFDINKDLEKVLRPEVFVAALKYFSSIYYEEDDKKLKDININKFISKRVMKKIEKYIKK